MILGIGYRIINEDRTYLNAGTGEESWFTIEEARKLVDYNIGQSIVEHTGERILWEVF